MSEESRNAAVKAAEDTRSLLLLRLYDEGAYNFARKLEKCGEVVPLTCTGCGNNRTGRTRCDQRWCPVCQRALATRTSMRYEKIAADCDWPIMLTLTHKHSCAETLTPKQLRRAFTKLRRLRWWRKRVRGGVAAFELTDNGNGWHTHIHALIDCQWLAVTEGAPRPRATAEEIRAKAKRSAREVAEQWSLCLGRIGGIHARRVRGGPAAMSDATKEVLKYAVKGTDLAEFPGPVAPVIRSMLGSRLVVSWGSFYRHPACKREKPAPAMCKCGCSDWMLEKTVDQVVQRIRGNGARRMTCIRA